MGTCKGVKELGWKIKKIPWQGSRMETKRKWDREACEAESEKALLAPIPRQCHLYLFMNMDANRLDSLSRAYT